MKQLEVFQNPKFGDVRVSLTENGEPLFCLADLCKVLQIKNSRNVRCRLDDDDVRLIDIIDNLGRTQHSTYVTESGFYEVVLRSDSDKARPFRKWVCNEILPAIRKDGGFIVSREDESDEDLMARALVVAKATLKRRNERIKVLETQTRNQQQEIEVKDARIIELDTAVNNMKPKVSYVDNILQCKETINVTQIAQDYGMSAKAFNILLRNLKIQHKVGQVWIVYGKYLAKGYVQSETFTYDKSNGTQGVRTFTKWSQRGRLFLYNTLKAHNIIPLIEQSTNNEK